MTDDNVTMQTHCPRCLVVQLPQDVAAFSYGEIPCHYCEKFTDPMTWQQWQAKVNKARNKRTHPPRQRQP